MTIDLPDSALEPEPEVFAKLLAPETEALQAENPQVEELQVAEPPKKRAKLPIIIAIIAVVALVGGFIGYQAYAAYQADQAQKLEIARANSEHPVTFAVELPSADTVGPIPLHITGTADAGDEVDFVGYLAADGTGVSLKNGSYNVHVVASPLVSGGVLFKTPPDIGIDLNGLDIDEAVTLSADAKLVFEPIAPIDVTDDQMQAAYSNAIAGGMPASSADVCRTEIATARQEAQAKAADEAAAKERLEKLSTIDLGDSSDYTQVNLFLSNFVEWPEFVLEKRIWGGTFDRSHMDLDQMANWAMWHLAINNDNVMSSSMTKIPGAKGGIGNDIDRYGRDEYPRSVDADAMADAVERYTGVRPDFTKLVGTYQYYKGRVYEGVQRGAANPLNTVALAKQVTPAGDKQLRIDFTAYRYGYSPSVVTNKSWYAMQPEELIEAMEAAYHPYSGETVDTWSGTAVVEINIVGGERTLALVSMTMS